MDTAEHDPFVGPWDEMDVFASFSGSVADVFSLTLTYSPWNSPPHAFKTEHNIDLKVSYDDSKRWGTKRILAESLQARRFCNVAGKFP